MIPKIDLSRYTYHLPHERIAQRPLDKRDSSKLLHYQNGRIAHHYFTDIVDLLDAEYTLFFNNTKVIPARLLFEKETGAVIEIFLLHPIAPTAVVSEAMLSTGSCVWQCVVGNLKRWKNEQNLSRTIIINGQKIEIKASIEDREALHIRLEWNTAIPFVDIVEQLGVMPLPPYIKRKAEQDDSHTYQTVYSKAAGAVAAPTAGLHFTIEILEKLRQKGVQTNELTLHVGAGTFQPIKTENRSDVSKHTMHCEQIVINQNNLRALLQTSKVAAVGTTSMRTLESLYWYGVQVLLQNNTTFFIEKLAPYQYENQELPSLKESCQAVLDFMERTNQIELIGETEIFILPTYEFKVCDVLITNFHMPETTLILLVAAFVGEDWKKIYESALANDYRFLSYGDSSILFKKLKS